MYETVILGGSTPALSVLRSRTGDHGEMLSGATDSRVNPAKAALHARRS